MNDSTDSKQESTSGLLRRMFRRVSSPKHADNVQGTDNLSSEKKTQMLIRKQRHDIERRKEFAELRELHAQRILQESGAESQQLGSEMSKTNSRQAETLEKINQLESQMASRWSRPQDSRSQETVAADPTAITLQEAVHTKSTPLNRADGQAPKVVSPKEFAESGLAELSDPVLEEIAVLFASNEDEQVELSLRNLIEEGSETRRDRPVWLTLFDYYRAVGNKTAYEEAAMEYTALFAESAPQWFMFDPSLARKQNVTTQESSSVYWESPEKLDGQTAKEMKQALMKVGHNVAKVMDWASLEEVTPEGAKIAVGVLKEMDKTGAHVSITSYPNVMSILRDRSKALGAQGDVEIWNLRLELMRLFESQDEFEMDAMEYCLAYEVSPPSWAAPKATVVDLDNMDYGMDDDLSSTSMNNASTIIGDLPTEFYGQNVRAPLRLRGIYKGTMAKDLKNIDSKILGQGGFLSISCDKLVRVDFASAGDLLNWISEKSAAGYFVHLVKVHRLVALFFIVMGVSASAKVSLRRD